ncbi:MULTISPECIES: inositol monophosphatase family protein [Streptomyces]|uniref:3'(2'),5'-bisphosphate nucleotidase CysQ n=2 Tax=Streptomyces rimosus subsp. rimosus TaxID=132474 RepID=L8EPX6_STRR1|nr:MULTISPECIES: inositol monophosphatase family protein [Streptomyces]KOG81533.1 inositol phosphatase [Kitasatospora aureofaciens]MYT42389.1 3'(2'),5'-bisphosphate nucleotidase CysQ [Streptomyces sp. SID5471]KEF05155.1 inositol phosphatase [Streptomyces rimosus]KOT30930.1 inositol phosphatase [Streptomyces sp. NRRL WC-3701]KOT31605.1 inositol phosphatase [Streptomyces rimosus subsp. rimosus]
MPESTQSTPSAAPAGSASDADLLAQTAIAVRAAASVLRERFGDVVRHRTREELMRALAANDDAALGVLRPRLTLLRPDARFVEDELAGGALPPGEWWVLDPAEGNVNHLHALPEWAVTATLVRDNQPVLTAVHLPLTGETYTALAGAGARLDGRPLHVSRTTDLGLSLVATSQARPDEDEKVVRRIGSSITAMLFDALVVRTSVPATLHLLNVAAGRIDAFWQFAGARADLLPGALLVAEAGGRISDAEGRPWTPLSESFLAAAPGVHTEAVTTLSR